MKLTVIVDDGIPPEIIRAMDSRETNQLVRTEVLNLLLDNQEIKPGDFFLQEAQEAVPYRDPGPIEGDREPYGVHVRLNHIIAPELSPVSYNEAMNALEEIYMAIIEQNLPAGESVNLRTQIKGAFRFTVTEETSRQETRVTGLKKPTVDPRFASA